MKIEGIIGNGKVSLDIPAGVCKKIVNICDRLVIDKVAVLEINGKIQIFSDLSEAFFQQEKNKIENLFVVNRAKALEGVEKGDSTKSIFKGLSDNDPKVAKLESKLAEKDQFIKDQAAATKETIEDLQAKLKAAQDDLKVANADLDGLKKKLEQADAQIADLDAAKTDLTVKVTDLTAELKAAKKV